MKPKYTRRELGVVAAGLGLAGGMTGALTSAVQAATSAEYYVSPNGDDSNDGSKANPLASPRPLTADGDMTAEDGSTIYFRGGGEIAYDQGDWFYDQHDLTLLPYGDGHPVLRATNSDKPDTFGPGLLQFGKCTGTVVKGLEVYDSPAGGIKFENCRNSTVEYCTVHDCDFSGISQVNGSDITIRYCESYGNFGPDRGEPGSTPGGDSDGIGLSAKKGTTMDGALIEYNLVHHNSDDGIDGIRCKNGVVRYNWVWANGYDSEGQNVETSRGAGIKLGYYDQDCGPWECYGNTVWYNGSAAFQYNWDQEPAHIYNNTGFKNGRKHESIGYINEDDLFQNPRTGSDTTIVGNVGRPGTTGPSRTEDNSWQTFDRYFDENWFESVAVDERGDPADPETFLQPTSGSPLRNRVSSYRESNSTTMGSTAPWPNAGARAGEGSDPKPDPEPEPEIPTEISYDGQTFTFDHSLHAIETVGLGPGYYNVTPNIQWAVDAHDGDLLVWITEPGTYSFRGQTTVGGDRTVALVVAPTVDGEVRFERSDGANAAAVAFDCDTAIVDGIEENGAIAFADRMQRANLDVDSDVRIREVSTYDHTVVVDGTDGRTDYGLRLGPQGKTAVAIEKSTARDASINPNDTIDRDTSNGDVVVNGYVSGGQDAYVFSGEIVDFDLANTSGTIRVWLDGREVDPNSLGRPDEHTITFDGRNGGGTYELTVTDEMIKSEANGASVNPNDDINGRTATGQVNGGLDSYEFDGEIESISADSGITVWLDGTEYDIGKRVVVERAPDSSGTVHYIIESNGTLEEAEGIGPDDGAAGSKAHGTVMSETDVYRLRDGEITDVSTFGGEVAISVDNTAK